MRFSNLMNNISHRSMIAYAPEGLGDGDGGDIDDDLFSEDGNQGDDSDDEPGSQSQNDTEITVGGDDDLANFWEGFGDSDEELTDEQLQQQLKDSEKAMGQQIIDGINNFAIPADLMPENFDPTDTNQLNSYVQKAVALGIQQSIQLMLAPMQTALKHHSTSMQRYVKRTQQDGFQNQGWEAALSNAIPAINDPINGPVIKTIAAQARRNSKGNDRAAIQSTLKALSAMGMNPRGNRTAQRTREAANTLDNYLPLGNLAESLRGTRKK